MAGMGAYGMYGLTGAGQQAGLDQAMSGVDVPGSEQVFGDSQTEIGDGSAGSKFNKYLTNPTATGAAAQANSTGNFLKDNWKYAAMAAGPIMADLAAKQNMPQTVTQPGMIRPYSYDPYSGGFTAGNPYEASVKRAASGGIMGFDESSNAPVTERNIDNMQNTGGMFNYAQDGGGVMKMASGGIAGYAAGGYTQDQINAALQAELAARPGTSQADLTNYAKSQYGLNDAQITAAYNSVNSKNGLPTPDTFTDEQLYQQTGSWAAAAAARDQQNRALNIYNDASKLYTTSGAHKPTEMWSMPGAVDPTQPGQYVQDPATGKYVALSATSAGFDPTNPITQTYLGELAAKGGQDRTSQLFNLYASQAQKDANAAAWAKEEARLKALDAAKGLTSNAGTGANANVDKGLAALNNLGTGASSNAVSVSTGETEAQRNNRLFIAAGGDWNKAADLRAKEDNAANAAKWQADANKVTAANKALVADPNYWLDPKGLAALNALPTGASDVDKWYASRGLGLDPIDNVINGFLAKYKPQLAAMLPKEQEDAMRAALDKERMNEADVIRATGMTIAQLAAAKRKDGSIIVPGDLNKVPVGSLPDGVSGAGKTVVNENGTITTRPDIPGIGTGFTGMTGVRKAYTDGGGSLGYTSPTYTPAEFKTKYEDKLTGGSADAYNYLTGKTKYSPIPSTPTGEVMKPYAESVLGIPTPSANKKYIFDPTTKTYKVNPNYAIPTYDSKGVKSSNLTNADVKTFMDKKPSASDFYTWATTNNLSPEQIAAASERPINEISKLFTNAKVLTGEDGKIDTTKVDAAAADDIKTNWDETAYLAAHPDVANELKTGKSVTGQPVQFTSGYEHYLKYGKAAGWEPTKKAAEGGLAALTMARGGTTHMPFFSKSTGKFNMATPKVYADGGMADHYNLGGYSDGGRLLRGPGDGVSDSIPATIGDKRPARLADGEFVVPARIVSELGNGSTEAGARKLYAMMDRVQAARKGSIGKGRVANNSRADKHLPA